jgi:murein DD-endopeptidase MepM/ murein hydrolase activator NlpD
MAVSGTIAAVPARAQTSNTDRQDQLRQQIAEISAEEATAQHALADIRDRKAVIDSRVADLDGRLASATARAAALDAEVTRLGVVLEDAERRLADTQAELDRARDEVKRSAAQIYRSARRGATFDVLTVSQPEDLVHGGKYLDEVNARQRTTVQHIGVLRDEVSEQREEVAERKQQADEAAAEAQRARDEIERTRAEIEPARAEAAAQADAESAQVSALASRKQEAEQELEAVSAAIAEELRRAAAAGGPVFASGSEGACDALPVSGTFSSGFGMRWGRMHSGIDVAAPTGTPIYSCWPGRVLVAGWQGGYGNTVVVDHGGGRATLYGHQSAIAVSVGQTVGAGELVGYVGSTGNSTGPHLHFEVRIDGDPVNPAPYL